MGAAPPGRAPFVVVNRLGNPVVRTILRSPAHRILSGKLALLTVTGRQSGERYTIPVGYAKTEAGIRIRVGWPQRKTWWRNLTGNGAPVSVRVQEGDYAGTAVAQGDEAKGVTVEVTLDGWPGA